MTELASVSTHATAGPAAVTPICVGSGCGHPAHCGIDATVWVSHPSSVPTATRTSCSPAFTV